MSVKAKGEIRPNSNPTPKAIEKRIRRRLASVGLTLQRTRAGSIAQAEHGEWLVLAPRTGEIIRRHFAINELAVEIGVINEGEVIGGAE